MRGWGGACVASGRYAWWGACMAGGCTWRVGGAWPGDMCGEGGMHGEGGHAWQRGMRGMHVPLLRDTAGQCAGGTHPTGMHSCFPYL